MRVGVYFGKKIFSGSNAGGGFTFQDSILGVLQKLESKHEFYIFADDADKFTQKTLIKFIKLERYYSVEEGFLKRNLFRIPRKIKRIKLEKQYKNPLNKAVLENNIELMWFVTPAYEFIQIPYIYTVWDLQHRLQSFFPEVSVAGWTFEKREERYAQAISRAAYVIIGNQAGRQELVKFYGMPDERIKTLGLPTPEFVFNSKKSENNLLFKYKLPENYLFYPAQFWPHKNHILILLALKILKEKYSLDFSLVLTGSDKGSLVYVKQKVRELGLQDRVHFLGFVSFEELVELYKNAFALVFPSFFGPDNIPPLEAFALRCPVIAANVSGAQYQLKDAVLLFDPKKEQDLAKQIISLYGSKKLRSDLIEKGFKIAISWTSKDYIANIDNIISEFEPIRRCWSNKKIYVHR